MEGISIIPKFTDSSLVNSEKMPKDTKEFSKILNLILGEDIEDKEIEEAVAYLMDQPILDLNIVEYYKNTETSSGENSSITGLDLEENLEKVITKATFIHSETIEDTEVIPLGEKPNLELENIEKSLIEENIEGKVDISKGELPVETKTKNLKDGKAEDKSSLNLKDNSLNSKSLISKEDLDIKRILKLESFKEDALDLKPEGKAENLKKQEFNSEEIEVESWGLKDMENSLREIEIKDMNLKDVEAPKLSRENIEIFKDSMVKLMETKDINGTKTMNVKLIPRKLGTIDISLNMEDGKLVAKLLFESEQTRQLFSNNIKMLNQSLQRQDITIEDIQIDLNLNSPSDSKERNQNHERPFKDRDIKSKEGIKETIEENIPIRENQIADGTVSILV